MGPQLVAQHHLFHLAQRGVVVDDDNWEIKSFSQLSDWGHHKSQPKPATT